MKHSLKRVRNGRCPKLFLNTLQDQDGRIIISHCIFPDITNTNSFHMYIFKSVYNNLFYKLILNKELPCDVSMNLHSHGAAFFNNYVIQNKKIGWIKIRLDITNRQNDRYFKKIKS